MEIRVCEIFAKIKPFEPLPFEQKVFRHVYEFRPDGLKRIKIRLGSLCFRQSVQDLEL